MRRGEGLSLLPFPISSLVQDGTGGWSLLFPVCRLQPSLTPTVCSSPGAKGPLCPLPRGAQGQVMLAPHRAGEARAPSIASSPPL